MTHIMSQNFWGTWMQKNKINLLVFPLIIAATVILTVALNDHTLKPIERKITDIERLLRLVLLLGIAGVVIYGGLIIYK